MRKLSQYFDYKLNGKDYKIRFKTPTVGEQIAIGQHHAALKAGFQQLDEISELLAFATATLNVVIENKPEDLNFEDLDPEDWFTIRKMLTDYQSFAFFRPKAPADTTTA
jgi:hypothetical protein